MPEIADTPQDAPSATQSPEQPDPEGQDTPEGDDAQQTFPAEYVRKLRAEAAEHRNRAKSADDLGRRLAVELVRATGRLADPTDLKFDPRFLTDDSAIGAALDDLLARKPHLAKPQRPSGDVGQGEQGSESPFSLIGALRGHG